MLAPCVSLLSLPAAGLQNRLLQHLTAQQMLSPCGVLNPCAESPQAMGPVLRSVHFGSAPSLSLCAPSSLGHELAQWMLGQPLAKQGFIYMYCLMTLTSCPLHPSAAALQGGAQP